jgi:hypothetical protein
MANLKLKNPSGGSLNFVSADGASDLTVTFPAATGTAMVSGNMPAFFAYQNASSQSLTGGATTKVTLDAELFDTNNNFASSRFTPTVAGYYQFNAQTQVNSSGQEIVIFIYKNGASYAAGMDVTSGVYNSTATTLAYANGTTDYFEMYCYVSTTRGVSNYPSNTYFTGVLVRAA